MQKFLFSEKVEDFSRSTGVPFTSWFSRTDVEWSDTMYGKCSIIPNTFHFLFSKKMWVIRARINKMLVRIANSEDPDQAASEAI